jgi:hypothetical protein
MPGSNADDFPPYGPVPDEIRKPARHWDPLTRPLPSRAMPDLRPAGQNHKLLQNKSTDQPNRATGTQNKLLRKNSDAAPRVERPKAPSFEELKKLIDEEQANRLNEMDGYNKTPPRPREGFGLQLRPQHDDINEYFTGPKWLDRFVESAELRPPPPIGPQIDRKPKPKVRYREEGEWVGRSEPPPPPPLPPPPRKKDTIFTAKKIAFRATFDLSGKDTEFANPDFLPEIQHVVKNLQRDADQHVEISAFVGPSWALVNFYGWPVGRTPEVLEFYGHVMDARNDKVGKLLEALGIDAARIHYRRGEAGVGGEFIKVEFRFFVPK